MIFKKLWLLFFCCIMAVTCLANSRDDVRRAGDIGKYALPLAAALITLYHEDYRGTAQAGLSIASGQLLSEGLKHVVTEYRPSGNATVSFPSGHAVAGFSSATFLWRRYGWEYGVPAMVGGAFIGFSRVYAKRHHVHDIYASLVFSSAMTLIFTEPFRVGNAEVLVTPTADTKNIGLSLTARV